MRTTGVMTGAVIAVAALFPAQAFAAEEHGLPGASMSLWWALPFAGLLLSIATGPLLFHHVWEHHYGKNTALWAALVVVPLVAAFVGIMLGGVVAAALLVSGRRHFGEYLPFGPFLAVGGIVAAVWGRPIMEWYLG